MFPVVGSILLLAALFSPMVPSALKVITKSSAPSLSVLSGGLSLALTSYAISNFSASPS